jgi:hypothetical protein
MYITIDSLWLCALSMCVVISFSHQSSFHILNMFEIMLCEGWRCNLNQCVDEEIRKWNKGMKEIKEMKESGEGWRYERNDSLLNFNRLFHQYNL